MRRRSSTGLAAVAVVAVVAAVRLATHRRDDRPQDDRPPAESLRDLPLVERPASTRDERHLAVLLSGDGGWARIDQALAAALADHGIPVVGLNSLRYFWSPRTPPAAARDLERILRHYLTTWQKDRVILVGYSRGASVLPFLATRLPADLQRRVDLIALLGAERRATFEFHLTDWFTGPRPSGRPTAPEIVKLGWTRVLCLYGDRERSTVCPDLPGGTVRTIRHHGGHHLGGDYGALARDIIENLPSMADTRRGFLRPRSPAMFALDVRRRP